MPIRILISVLLLTLARLGSAANSGWSVVRSEHFEVFSQAGSGPARDTLERLERLRLSMAASGLPAASNTRVRVIGFRSREEYQEYRLRPLADAFYLGTADRDFLVLPGLTPEDFGMAAHEYAHALLHASGFNLPLWLGEGLAEYYANSGNLAPMRRAVLKDAPWLDLRDLLARQETASPADREGANLFYAESAALVQMLAGSAPYRAHFGQVVAKLNAGEASLEKATGRSLGAITLDLRKWVEGERGRVAGAPEPLAVKEEAAQMSEEAAASMLAELKAAEGGLSGATADSLTPQKRDDGQYVRALAAFNAGNYRPALELMRGLGTVSDDRKFNYYMIAAFALLQSGEREEAAKAAAHAREFAANAQERSQAAQLQGLLSGQASLRMSHEADGRNCISSGSKTNSLEE